MTGKGLRTLCITLLIQAGLPAADTARLARHRSIKSQESYERETSQHIMNRHLALRAEPIPEQNENIEPVTKALVAVQSKFKDPPDKKNI
jgi:hypothetical protein